MGNLISLLEQKKTQEKWMLTSLRQHPFFLIFLSTCLSFIR